MHGSCPSTTPVAHPKHVERPGPFSVEVLVDLRINLVLDGVDYELTLARISEATERHTALVSAVQEHEYAVCREFLDLSWYAKLIKRLQRRLTLIIFHHISLRNRYSNLIKY